jgi:hypothetical protein
MSADVEAKSADPTTAEVKVTKMNDTPNVTETSTEEKKESEENGAEAVGGDKDEKSEFGP